MAKLKERKLYLKGVQKFNQGGLTSIPQSPFTRAGLKDAGIAALNNLKSPTKALLRGGATVLGLTNPFTAPLAVGSLTYGALDAVTPESIKQRARLANRILPAPAISDTDIPEDLPTRAELSNKLNTIINQKAKMDDRETGAELVEKGGSKIKPDPNQLPQNPNEQAQMAVTKQKQAIKSAENIFLNLKGKALKSGKISVLGNALEQAKAVMGEQGYDKSGRLLLLQLASNLLTGKTMQPGVTGFLDVLGQAGQKVLPMAIALERERQKDEIDLAKILLSAGSKGSKLAPPSIKLRYKLPDGSISDPLPASTTDRGTYMVYDQLPDGQVVNYEISPAQVIGQADIKDSPVNKAKILNEYKAVRAGELYTNTFLEVASQNPKLIGVKGGMKKIGLKVFELYNIATGSKSYQETIKKLVDKEKAHFEAFQQYGEVEEGVREKLNGVFSKIENLASDLDGASEEIQAQSLLETLSLLSTYSLAQILKDKDRLAIKDIEKAAEEVGNVIGYIPFVDKNPIDIITSYQIINQKFKNRIKNLRGQWKDIYYYNPLELDAIDKIYATEMKDPRQENINKFVSNFDQQNNQDAEMFSKFFNKDNLKGIIGKQK